MNKKQSGWRYGFATLIIISGIILSYLNIGNEFLGFSSIGSWLIYVGFVMLVVVTLQFMSKKKRIVDERMQFVAMKAAKITFTTIILFAFVTMILDGIKPITVRYSYFMSYFVCGIVIIYLSSYKIMLKYN